ncbi:MAG: large-conductance mechanosensitive channel protein MscL [Ignavibacteriales bacterium]|nr:Large-conductance mechanosensitive channel [Ignavibacteriaceae bacterium]MCK6614389.1 large-conductance mechanosensitive channel protein MscL [Ignavibacteriaceae bacterium]QOJ27775.1 MAG: large-conductance mechanosensitive channel protein MscL [Ignavibacteriales bacterium]
MSLLKEFKEFANRGSIVDLATGVIIGGAFGKIVSSLVNDIIMPPIGLLLGDLPLKDLKFVLKQGAEANPVTLNYGNFLLATVDFLIIAWVIFLMLKGLNKLKRKEEEKPAAPPPVPEDVVLLREIRDLLKKQ